jgi:hypothetical protein
MQLRKLSYKQAILNGSDIKGYYNVHLAVSLSSYENDFLTTVQVEPS